MIPLHHTVAVLSNSIVKLSSVECYFTSTENLRDQYTQKSWQFHLQVPKEIWKLHFFELWTNIPMSLCTTIEDVVVFAIVAIYDSNDVSSSWCRVSSRIALYEIGECANTCIHSVAMMYLWSSSNTNNMREPIICRNPNFIAGATLVLMFHSIAYYAVEDV